MCGKETDLFRTVIEGTELKVCKQCAGFGKVLQKIRVPVKEKKKKIVEQEEEEPEIIQAISADCAKKVKQARESMGLKQEELAKKLNEKESIIHKIETGHYKPNMKIAQKLEKFLKIKLIEEYKAEKAEKKPGTSSEGLTIGDLIKLK
jgi:putative transcription factor